MNHTCPDEPGNHFNAGDEKLVRFFDGGSFIEADIGRVIRVMKHATDCEQLQILIDNGGFS